MHYVAAIDGEEREVDITETAPGRYQLTVNGKKIEVDAQEVSPTTLHFLLDNHAYNIEIEHDKKGGENLLVRGQVLHVETLDLRTMRLRRSQVHATGVGGPATISSPMPGKIVAVLVKEGQEVTEGQGLIVVEAMKMENELRAPKAGKITRLSAKEGTAVDSGATLCVID
jgi:biotin carboxyl carrier protein